jgi:hypothetical protein
MAATTSKLGVRYIFAVRSVHEPCNISAERQYLPRCRSRKANGGPSDEQLIAASGLVMQVAPNHW